MMKKSYKANILIEIIVIKKTDEKNPHNQWQPFLHLRTPDKYRKRLYIWIEKTYIKNLHLCGLCDVGNLKEKSRRTSEVKCSATLALVASSSVMLGDGRWLTTINKLMNKQTSTTPSCSGNRHPQTFDIHYNSSRHQHC